ncbi:MAG: hypothetical protein E2O54_12875 [Gammaproteobacteria bacterium]|nr:MAG: hypothetical protein E2O54_12875 [Gammaproteobacteria bacterium]
MASAMLFAGVLAVITAIMGGQKRAFEAQRRMEAALIAEERMGQVAVMAYGDLYTVNPMEPVGPFYALTTNQLVDEDLPGLGVRVRGTQVHVTIVPSLSEIGVTLAEAKLFIPEPQP